MAPASTIPGHLRRFVVRQDYAKYTEQDQAVWRFVVLQTHSRLLTTAHDAYAKGFDAAGISVDRIPRVDEMNDKLGRFGWGAVCVDGFISPRAFQAFQARGILPIAADIRTSKHLTYTPAPDIIHEAAGHAPFLADARYARYVRRIGEVARRAFAVPSDRAVYDAIYQLSELKEDPASTLLQVRRAEQALSTATSLVTETSESAKIARLYWWTAEYGLVGSASDFRLYGAGLLSSIGEGYFCRLPDVKKLALTRECVEFDYDVTRAQPQLFVAKNFGQLEEVLDEVDATLSYRTGGVGALAMAKRSEELATVALDSGVEVIGVVTTTLTHEGRPSLIGFKGPTALAHGGMLVDGMPRRTDYLLPLGVLLDGTPLSSLTPDDVLSRAPSGNLILELRSGLVITGGVRAMVPMNGRVGALLLSEFELWRGEERLLRANHYALALGASVETAWAGAPDAFFPDSPASTVTVPKARTFSEPELEMIALYDRAITAFGSSFGSATVAELAVILAQLDDSFPDEWLLRWNLLESLAKLGEGSDLAGRLERDLERLELRYDGKEPIATGLDYVRSLLGLEPSRGHRNAG
ncbi:MAG TPA: aromatic amino acid hydroxylase [Polyangiaceae bacterium]|jgi:phenylalanine-4-hydroxylase|nr:aromatic amino acid hydroxylase [Polyangiaceae bacterium]